MMAEQQQQQQAMSTIHEYQHNNVLIDLEQESPMAPPQHAHHAHMQLAGEQQHEHMQQQQQAAITSQPGQPAGSARVAPESQNVVYSVHPVFSMLDHHDTLLVRQRADCTSTCCGFESVNTYTVRSKDGAPVLKAIESSNCCERCCFEGNREYNLSLVHGDEVVARVRKPYRVSRFCCYSNAVRIESPEDNPIGHIKQVFTLFGHPRYAIFDCQQSPKTPSFYVESTSCRFCCMPCLCTCVCANREFRIVSVDTREEVGTIARRLAPEGAHHSNGGQQRADDGGASPDGDQQPVQQQPHELEGDEQQEGANGQQGEDPFKGGQRQQEPLFGVRFAANLEARHKVLLLSACFMMDFFYFETDRRRRKLASC